jgi:Ca-activated chloride channel homolog
MTLRVLPMDEPEVTALTQSAPAGGDREAGLGTLQTERGNLPLESVNAAVRITGLIGRIELTQGFHNPHDVPLEATYVFPLPDRAAVTAMQLTADDRTVRAELRERGAAREEYDRAVAAGQRAAIAEEERPDVFTMRVGNILPGERVSVALTLVGPLSYEDGEATFRLPLVVAPRYIPGATTGTAVGDGYAADTDAVPDASRITPPILLPGFPNPVRLGIAVDIDSAGLPLSEVRSSLHAVITEGSHLEIQPGERANRDFILRLSYGEPDASAQALTLTPDAEGEEGTFRLTILPPRSAAPARPRDVVLVLDRSGSMMGWKMVAARRAAARIVDTLTAADRFAVLAFDDRVDHPTTLGVGLHPATDRNRFLAVEFLASVQSRGGTELLAPFSNALGLLTDAARDRVVVLVTDGQVGNEDQILARSAPSLTGIRVHTVGIDQAVNAGFLGRLAAAGGGRCELVESEDRLDAAMDQIHRRIGAPVVSGLTLTATGLDLVSDTMAPARLPDLFPGAPLVVTGRYLRTRAGASMKVNGRTRPGEPWSADVQGATVLDASVTAVWARAHLRDLEDRYVSQAYGGDAELEQRIVATSVRFGVLCRFTAWVAIDDRVVTDGAESHRVIQPVEMPAGWDMAMPAPPAPSMMLAGMARPFAAAAGNASRAYMMAEESAPGTYMQPRSMRKRSLKNRLRRPAAAVPDATEVAEELMESEAPASVRELAAGEAERLRSAAAAPEYERRELLADLGTRLEALARDLGGSSDAAAVRQLAADLAEDHLAGLSGDALADLWDRALQILDHLAGEPPATGGPATGGSSSGQPPAAFWKRT